MDSLICNIGEGCQKLLVFDKEVPSTISIESVNFLPLDDIPHLGAFNSSRSFPYPAVDLFVESVGSIENIAVMYIVDFRVVGYYEKCHDPDCRGEKRFVTLILEFTSHKVNQILRIQVTFETYPPRHHSSRISTFYNDTTQNSN